MNKTTAELKQVKKNIQKVRKQEASILAEFNRILKQAISTGEIEITIKNIEAIRKQL